MKIGIGLTFRNRIATTIKSLSSVCKFAPSGSKIVTIDDASETNAMDATFRFEQNVGVATVKNKCIELLDDCDFLFLLDNDIIVKSELAFLNYINSGLEHACYTFNRGGFISMGTNYVEYGSPNGCMLFFTRKCIDTVGGFDNDFKGYGYDHSNMSDRIFNNGLTPARYIDIRNSQGLFEMIDVPSTFSQEERIKTIPINQKLYKERYLSKEFKPYK